MNVRSAVAAARRTEADVIVIGAGLAGLTAARDLAAAGYHVAVLEARDSPDSNQKWPGLWLDRIH